MIIITCRILAATVFYSYLLKETLPLILSLSICTGLSITIAPKLQSLSRKNDDQFTRGCLPDLSEVSVKSQL